MDGIYAMVANKRTPFAAHTSSSLYLCLHPFFLKSCRFVSKQNSCVCVFVCSVERFLKRRSKLRVLQWWCEWKMCLGWSLSESLRRRFFVHTWECCCCIGGFSSIEKCILLSWPSNLVILWIKVIKVSTERILKCVEFLRSMNGWQFT